VRFFYFFASFKGNLEDLDFREEFNWDSVSELQRFLLNSYTLLLAKLEPFSFIHQQVVLVASRNKLLVECLRSDDCTAESFIQDFEEKLQ